jgi:hypothetical protein
MISESHKTCIVCGKSFPMSEFDYGNRANNSYCRQCAKGYGAAYTKGGQKAGQEFLEREKAKWQTKS